MEHFRKDVRHEALLLQDLSRTPVLHPGGRIQVQVAGGLPCSCFHLVQGDPGSGKTTLALQFLFEGLRRGERVLYITLSETKAELERVTRSHGWSLDGIPLIELSAIESLLRPEAQTTVFHASEVELSKVSGVLLDEIRKHNDGELSEVAEEFSNRGERRALIFRMKDRPRRTAWEVDSP